VLVLPWDLETELTAQLSHVVDWGGQLVYPLPSLHTATLHRDPLPRRMRMVR